MTTRDSRLPFTALLPDVPTDPVEIHDHSVGLRMALVGRMDVSQLADDWNSYPGVYLLLDPIDATGKYGVYVGKSPAGLKNRLGNHSREKKTWARALLIQRATLHGLTSSHAGWLEGDLYDLFKGASKAIMSNVNTPGDDTVPSYDLRMLESFRDPIIRMLRFLGYDPDSTDEVGEEINSLSTPTQRNGERKKHYGYGVSLQDLIQSGYLDPGMVLVSVNTAWPAEAILNADGTVLYDGLICSTLSNAAQRVRGGASNGWDFWAVEIDGKTRRISAIRADYQSEHIS